MATTMAVQENVELLTEQEQSDLGAQLTAELEAVADAFLGTTEWRFSHLENDVDGSKFYRVYVRSDGRGTAYTQWGPRMVEHYQRDYTGSRGQHLAVTPDRADQQMNDKVWKGGYEAIERFRFRAPADASFDDLGMRAAAAMSNPQLRVR